MYDYKQDVGGDVAKALNERLRGEGPDSEQALLSTTLYVVTLC